MRPGNHGIKEDKRSDSLLLVDYFKTNQFVRCYTLKCLGGDVILKCQKFLIELSINYLVCLSNILPVRNQKVQWSFLIIMSEKNFLGPLLI